MAAPTQLTLDSWPQEARKFGLTHLLDYYRVYHLPLAGQGPSGGYQLYLDECHALKDSHEPGLKAHAAKKRSILGLTSTRPRRPTAKKAD